MSTQTKKKPKKKTKVLSFAGLMRRVTKHPAFPSLLRTAKETGWLTGEEFMTRLTEKEALEVRDLYNKTAAAKRADTADLSLPAEVGPMVETISYSNGQARLGTEFRNVTVDAILFLTMQKRHPLANVYMSPAEDGPVIFSEKSTAAVLSVQK